ncbi:HWE histidine kinase domain-containing protein [Aurantiacibacter gangjinensis]|uniref:histidine kinase n=1 Tax=Aurantiacibacter gangjinensis TaxID=502682 RepID=A0A0G9MM84_9SPHN|nr:HWE histidine kinase domain-containing protein [Aurantiacibacter gangjinensis]APE27815.1 Phytochrome, two-component sensor histidine kinase [Aurantiacibacter gangjinensis]KLE31800.1 hypothetical protein AAW01_09905 [Aurantiacibacter gangjinensis]
MNVHDPKVDLTSCDREPIHQLGQIQPFGALIAVTADWIIAFQSANADDIIDARKPFAIGNNLSDYLDANALRVLRERAGWASRSQTTERLFGCDLLRSGKRFDIAIHCSDGYTVLEIEPGAQNAAADHSSAIRPMMDHLRRCEGVDKLCQGAAEQLKRLLGFDRVMVYRFHPDESGEVIAEAREGHIDGFMGLRYPRTDIPQQARALYLKNLFRIISDVSAEPVPILPEMPLDGRPLDLSQSTLRAVSPVHIEYLQNMGVEASLSISIVVNGKLWGLFACHHYSPRVLAFPQRTAAELFAQLFSMQLELTIRSAGEALKDRSRELHNRLMNQMGGGDTLTDSLDVIERTIGDLIPHDGLSAYIDGTYRSHGAAPNAEEFEAIVPALNTSSTSTIVHSDSLVGLIPAAAAFKDRVVGALIIPVSRSPRDYMVLWRKEIERSVTWAGNPDKPVQPGPNGDRLTPRKSFEAWKQTVSGRSTVWSEEELAIAEGLRVTLLEVILRVTDAQVRERTRAQERQELLIAELNHRVRNILTLIRSLIGQSRGEVSNIEEFSDLVGGRIQALARAHDHITREQWDSASLRELIESEAEAYLSGKRNRITVTGDEALITPEAFTVLALVVHEMMTNSAKYGSLCDSSGRLEITTQFTKHRDLAIKWREIGGPPVKAPERRGFGTTIIERSIPFELKGTADVSYKVSGLEADFLIPSRYATQVEADENAQADTAKDSPMTEASGEVSHVQRDGVLLVEDSMIIAMDVEDMLRGIGYKTVTVASTPDQALSAIDKAMPGFAILDFNLGDSTSEPVAQRLAEEGVPFWFATGYGDAVALISESAARGVLQKPYTKQDLERIVAELQAEEGAA